MKSKKKGIIIKPISYTKKTKQTGAPVEVPLVLKNKYSPVKTIKQVLEKS
jgi:hypothetical protein